MTDSRETYKAIAYAKRELKSLLEELKNPKKSTAGSHKSFVENQPFYKPPKPLKNQPISPEQQEMWQKLSQQNESLTRKGS